MVDTGMFTQNLCGAGGNLLSSDAGENYSAHELGVGLEVIFGTLVGVRAVDPCWVHAADRLPLCVPKVLMHRELDRFQACSQEIGCGFVQ